MKLKAAIVAKHVIYKRIHCACDIQVRMLILFVAVEDTDATAP